MNSQNSGHFFFILKVIYEGRSLVQGNTATYDGQFNLLPKKR